MDWLSNLNDEQRKAVLTIDVPLYIVAGAGTGKTRTLTVRIANLIKNGVQPFHILALTFTNKAAREMRDRISEILGEPLNDSWILTFHSFGANILRRHITSLELGYTVKFKIIDNKEQEQVIKEVLKKLEIEPKKVSIKLLQKNIGSMKTMKNTLNIPEETRRIFETYQNYLISNDLVDFDDLLIYTEEIFRLFPNILDIYRKRFLHILVDEFQDTDIIQYNILRLLGRNCKNVFVVGDPDQSIYSFRGANYNNSINFLDEFKAKIIILNVNYRSPNNILNLANKLISKNVTRVVDKVLKSNIEDKFTPKINSFESDQQEVYAVIDEIKTLVNRKKLYSYSDIAILYRNNSLSKNFEDGLINSSIPFIIYGGISFYQRKEIKDILAYIYLIIDTDDDYHLKRIINIPSRKIGEVTISKLIDYASSHGLSIFNSIDKVELPAQADASLHKFKNLILNLGQSFREMADLSEIIPLLLTSSGYEQMLKDDLDDISKERLSNIQELQASFLKANESYEGNFSEKLNQLLDNISLYTSLDTNENQEIQSVKLATIHQVKGLEFKVVFLVCFEDGIIPSLMNSESTSDIEEERRVAYVAITRAKEILNISYSKSRWLYTGRNYAEKSRFLNDIETVKKNTYIETKETHSQNTTFYKIGDHIVHDFFGEGVIVSINEKICTIAFNKNFGIRKISIDHPSLKLLK